MLHVLSYTLIVAQNLQYDTLGHCKNNEIIFNQIFSQEDLWSVHVQEDSTPIHKAWVLTDGSMSIRIMYTVS